MADKAVKVGWIGTGVMGKSMVGHLLKNGHKLMVYNRTVSKTSDLTAAGAKFMTPPEIAREADFLFLMLGYPHDVEDILLNKDTGILKLMKPHAHLIDHTTSSPELAARIEMEATGYGVDALDAPVSGGDIGAKNGQLVVMVGGEKKSVDACRPLMDVYSKEVQHMGKAGAGQHTKAAN